MSFASKEMSEYMRHVLFLCTGNSARSIIAEGILRTKGAGRFASFSAGSKPTGTPNEGAIAVLEANGIETSFAASKSWDVFSDPAHEDMHLVITVCGNAAGEVCPIWPGQPVTAHWGVEDPAAVTQDEAAIRAAFAKTYDEMDRRIAALLCLDEHGDKDIWINQVREIGKIDD